MLTLNIDNITHKIRLNTFPKHYQNNNKRFSILVNILTNYEHWTVVNLSECHGLTAHEIGSKCMLNPLS
jgi:predicted flavoprotein YhiN